MVRHAPAGNRWHQAQDDLFGTDVYGIPTGPAGYNQWSIEFNTIPHDEFLFTRDKCEKWLIALRASVIGPDGDEYYENGKRQIVASSDSNTSYYARWYRRTNAPEDP